MDYFHSRYAGVYVLFQDVWHYSTGFQVRNKNPVQFLQLNCFFFVIHPMLSPVLQYCNSETICLMGVILSAVRECLIHMMAASSVLLRCVVDMSAFCTKNCTKKVNPNPFWFILLCSWKCVKEHRAELHCGWKCILCMHESHHLRIYRQTGFVQNRMTFTLINTILASDPNV